MKLIVIGAAVAVLSSAACGNANKSETIGTSGRIDRPVAVAGCLQKGAGGDYILTELSEPATGGTATTPEGDRVQREQMNAAAHAYRLRAASGLDDNDWDKLVGMKVKIDGTMATANTSLDALRKP